MKRRKKTTELTEARPCREEETPVFEGKANEWKEVHEKKINKRAEVETPESNFLLLSEAPVHACMHHKIPERRSFFLSNHSRILSTTLLSSSFSIIQERTSKNRFNPRILICTRSSLHQIQIETSIGLASLLDCRQLFAFEEKDLNKTKRKLGFFSSSSSSHSSTSSRYVWYCVSWHFFLICLKLTPLSLST